MIYAVYRLYTGYTDDFIQESVLSIEPFVDKIFIFWTHKALADCTSAIYKGQTYRFPENENTLVDVYDLCCPKIIMIEDYVSDNTSQFTHLANDYILSAYNKPDMILFIEPDHVFRSDMFQQALEEFQKSGKVCASTRQVELWRYPYYVAVPERMRLSSVFWNMKNLNKVPETGKHANPPGSVPFLNAKVHNLGFCMSEKNMFLKHLTALAFSAKLKDSRPDPNWYDKWLHWKYDSPMNKNLEISLGHSNSIQKAELYNVQELPEMIKRQYGIRV